MILKKQMEASPFCFVNTFTYVNTFTHVNTFTYVNTFSLEFIYYNILHIINFAEAEETMIKNFYKKVTVIILIVVFITGCGKSPSVTRTSDNLSKVNSKYVETLSSAKQIEIKENFISLGKKYTLYVNGKAVGTVTGKLINLFGDVFTLKDKSGTVLAKENQIKRWHIKFDRSAEVLDAKDNTTGYIGEEALTKIFSIGYFFHFFDKNKKEIGTSDQVNFSLFKKNIFKNSDGSTAYKVSKKFTLLSDAYELNIIDSSKIPLYQAIFMVCIEDAIKDSKAKKKKN
jgi:uncharacterized protein YxjI